MDELAVPGVTTKVVVAGPGRLGLSVVFDESGGAVISGIGEACGFRDEVQLGDRILTIDGEKVCNGEDLRIGNDRVRQLGILPGEGNGPAKRKRGGAFTDAERWECAKCAHRNAPSKARCSKCQGWRGVQEMKKRKEREGGPDAEGWECHKCAHVNGASLVRCGKCRGWKGGRRENIRDRMKPGKYGLWSVKRRGDENPDLDEISFAWEEEGEDDKGKEDDIQVESSDDEEEILDGGLWRCRKCAGLNEVEKVRCGQCQGWRGGKRYNVRGKRDKSNKKKKANGPDDLIPLSDAAADNDDENGDDVDDDEDDGSGIVTKLRPLDIEMCKSAPRLEKRAARLEEILRSTTDELQRVRRRLANLNPDLNPDPDAICTPAPVLVPCAREGCNNMTQHGGLCSVHQRESCGPCTVEGCNNQAEGQTGICRGHTLYPPGGAKRVCAWEGCNNRAKAYGNCMRHNETKPAHWYCRVEGCEKKSQRGGVCVMHGAKMPECQVEGCSSRPKKGGLCHRHLKLHNVQAV